MKISFNPQKNQKMETMHGMQVPYAAAKRKASQWRWYLILLIVLSPLLYFLYSMIASALFITCPGYVSFDKVPINSSTSGYLYKIYVKQGQTVTAEQIVAELKIPELDEKRNILETKLDIENSNSMTLENQLENLIIQRVRIAENEVSYQREKKEKVHFLFDQGAATLAELDAVESQYNRALLSLNSAKSQLAQAQNRNKSVILEATKNDPPQARLLSVELKSLKAKYERLIHRSPTDGRVIEIIAEEGRQVGSGEPLLVLVTDKRPQVIAYLSPERSKYAKTGYKAVVKFADNTKVNATVEEDAIFTRRLPANLTSPIGARDLMIVVKLAFDSTLTSKQSIEGLPVTVRFKFRKKIPF